jgi:hypothetical protein
VGREVGAVEQHSRAGSVAGFRLDLFPDEPFALTPFDGHDLCPSGVVARSSSKKRQTSRHRRAHCEGDTRKEEKTMGFIDKIKGALGGASDKAGEMADKAGVGGVVDKVSDAAEGARHSVGGVVEGAVDKVADAADSATKGKFTEQIDKVRDVADKIDGEVDGEVADAPEAETPEEPAE